MSANCGRESCLGKACGNFVQPEKGGHGCRGVDWSKPPWNSTPNREPTGTRHFHEPSFRECARRLADAVAAYLTANCTVATAERGRCWNCDNCDEPLMQGMCQAWTDFVEEQGGIMR